MHTSAPPALVIRPANPDEIPLVRELFLEYAHSLNFDLAFQKFDEELAGLPGKYAPPLGRLLLAFYENRAAGCIALRPFDPAHCEMKRLYVRPAFRGRGVGEALIDRFFEEARAIGSYQSVVLDTVSPLMDAAIRMYRRIGFREIAPYCVNPVQGAVYMERTLAPGQAQ